jgi:hypothetical protein
MIFELDSYMRLAMGLAFVSHLYASRKDSLSFSLVCILYWG